MSDVYRFASFSSFCGVPTVPIGDVADSGAEVVILGAPIDWGATYRGGARFGPKAIREADYLDADMRRPHLPTGIDPFEQLSVVDVGDIAVAPGYLELGLETLAETVERIARGARSRSCSAVTTRSPLETEPALPAFTATGPSASYTLMHMPTPEKRMPDSSTGTARQCGGSSNQGRCQDIASSRSACAATGPAQQPSPG